MRPVPPSRHTLAALILIAVAAAAAALAMRDSQISPVQVNIACAAWKDLHADSFSGDLIFGTKLWLFHTPMLLGLLKFILVPTNYIDLVLPFRLIVGPVTLLFLGGMYALAYRQTRSWSVSTFVAVLSMTVITVLGGATFGMGTLASMTPQTLLLAMTPLIVLAFLNYEEHWRLVLVFLFIGAMGNLHLVSAMNLTLVLLIAYLGRHWRSPAAWLRALQCGLCSLVAALPYAAYYFTLRSELSPSAGPVSVAAVQKALESGEEQMLFPDLLKDVLEVDLLWRLVVLGVVAVGVLSRWERFRLRDGSFWLWMILAALLVSLGFQGVSQLVGESWGVAPPVIDFLKASPLLLLPLYVLLGQGVVNLFRLVGKNRRLVQWACIALAVAWMVPSDNLEWVRQKGYLALSKFLSEPNKPRQLRKIEDDAQRQRELECIADWARNGGHGAKLRGQLRRADAASLFITDRTEFRILARRPIVAAADDVRFLYYLQPARIEQWRSRYDLQQHLLNGTPDEASLREFFAGLTGEETGMVKQWYILADTSVTEYDPIKYGSLQNVAEVTSPDWGKQYRVYWVDRERVEKP